MRSLTSVMRKEKLWSHLALSNICWLILKVVTEHSVCFLGIFLDKTRTCWQTSSRSTEFCCKVLHLQSILAAKMAHLKNQTIILICLISYPYQYTLQQLLCQCNSSELFDSVAFNILSIVSAFTVSLNFRRSSRDSFNEHSPCWVALKRNSLPWLLADNTLTERNSNGKLFETHPFFHFLNFAFVTG